MPVYMGIDGVVRMSGGVSAGAGHAVRTVSQGRCGVNHVVRQFWGPLEGLEYFAARNATVMGYRYDAAAAAWTGKKELVLPSSSGGALEDYGEAVIREKSISVTANTLHYFYFYCNLAGVFSNGREVRLDKLVSTYSIPFHFPAGFIFRRTAGSGTWSGALRLCGKTVNPSGFSSNTQYTGYTSELVTENAYNIYSLLYDRGGVNGVSLDMTFSTITLDGVEYPVRLT